MMCKKNNVIHVRATDDVKNQLAELANRYNLSQSVIIEKLIQKAYKGKGL